MVNAMLENDLDRVERELALDLGRRDIDRVRIDDTYYPQIEGGIRAEARRMAPHYEVFYSLEKTIRGLVADSLEAEYGNAWWTTPEAVPNGIREEAEKRRQRELDSGMTPRSSEPLDFSTFGELGELIKFNWDLVFGSMFTSVKAVQEVMSKLNTLRGPIAHCSPLAEDEVVRLRLAVSDWFRLME
jgi:hypothetical protein